MHELSRRHAIGGLLLLITGSAGAARVLAGEPARLAIQGYDPVAYFTLGRPARGQPELEFEWDEQRYRFASAEHRAMFAADPVRYAPQFAGLCALSLTRGEITEPNPEFWLVADGRLYLFGKPIGPGVFQKDLADNLAKVDQHRAVILKR
jgi:hypothetical protein